MSRRPASPGRALALAAGLALMLLGAVSTARASRDYESEVIDDQLFLSKPATTVAHSIGLAARLGADRIRVSAFWRDIAPGRNKRRRPGFDARDPNARGYRWTALDRVVTDARLAGMNVLVSVTGPGPLWASESPSYGRLWLPRPSDYANFAEAVARRYAPMVDRYAIWNEPNQGAWLQPQSLCRRTRHGRTCRPVSPHHYRRLALAAYPRIKAADPAATVLVGELAPSGRNDRGPTRPIRPLRFLREMACRTERYKPIRGGPCRDFRPVLGDAIGHHPYSVFLGPGRKSATPDDATLGDTRRLLTAIDRLQRKRALRSSTGRRFDLFYTEYGYQTDPPDPFSGIGLRAQSRWLQEAAYLVWRNPRVRSLNQFRLADGPLLKVPGPARYLEFQSGLRFSSGRAKPSYRSWPNPFRVSATHVRRGAAVSLWGQVRFGASHPVTIESRVGGAWRPLAMLTTDRFGVFTHRVTVQRTSSYRFRYADAGARRTSDSLRVRVR